MSQENERKPEYMYDYNVENKASSTQVQVATVMDSDAEVTHPRSTFQLDDKMLRDIVANLSEEELKHAAMSAIATKLKAEEDKRSSDSFSGHVSTKDDTSRGRQNENLRSHDSKKEAKRRDKRDEDVTSHDATAREGKREDKHHGYQKKSKVAGRETSQKANYHSKGSVDTFSDFNKDTGVVEQHQAVSDFAVAENQGSVKHILILGTIGCGKYTIAKNISSDCRTFPSRSSLRQSGIIQYIDDGDRFKFVLVDTGGARMPDVWGAKGPTIGEIAAQIRQLLKGGISLIIIVVRYDCNTPEDMQVLVNIIKALFTDEATKHIALVHNGCEVLSSENVSQYIKHFKAEGPSRQLSSLCGKAILATAFPNLDEARFEMVEYFEQTIENSKKHLSALIESCKYLQPYSEILKARNEPSRVFPENKPDCSIM